VGHLRYLESARGLGDLLIVGVNGDSSVKQIKGPDRPLIGEDQRAELVAALHCVDYATLFNAPDPLELIELISPDILVKGADWPLEKIIGGDIVMKKGGSVVRIPFVQGSSTTTIIDRILTRFSKRTVPE
jgi:D-beta-D-heptose 7-phosphate kinase/D-beta-D-heptose 1-phosphate adenosyltransferase